MCLGNYGKIWGKMFLVWRIAKLRIGLMNIDQNLFTIRQRLTVYYFKPIGMFFIIVDMSVEVVQIFLCVSLIISSCGKSCLIVGNILFFKETSSSQC